MQFGKGIALIASVNYYAPLQKLLKFVLPAKVREKVSLAACCRSLKLRNMC